MHVIIVGAGWAGLAAAVELSRAGLRPTLIEAAKQCGGRARRIDVHGTACDNGQHLLLGAYTRLLAMLETVGVAEQDVLLRRPLQLEMRAAGGAALSLSFPALPAPWHVIAGFLRAEGLSLADRWRALKFCARTARAGFNLDPDENLAGWLRRAGQGEKLIGGLWEPLCLAALNTPVERASAQVFLRVLREAFAGRRRESDMLFPRSELGGVFPQPALHYLQARGTAIRRGERVLALNIDQGRVLGVTTRRGRIPADHVILATAPEAALKLMDPHPALGDTARGLSALGHEPICTVYFQYPAELRLDREMVGLLGGVGQWLLDLDAAGRPGRMAVVISGPGPHMAWDNTVLIARVREQLAQHFPHWPPPQRAWVIREKRATFSCRAGVAALRPAARTPVAGLWLAGDYTDTGLPATLEGALRSGCRSAAQVLMQEGLAMKAMKKGD